MKPVHVREYVRIRFRRAEKVREHSRSLPRRRAKCPRPIQMGLFV
jgi:hypothetical protein